MQNIPCEPYLDTLTELCGIPLKFRDLDTALNQIVRLCRRTLKSHICTIAHINLEQKTLIQKACAASDPQFEQFMNGRVFEIGEQWIDFDTSARGKIIQKYDLTKNGEGVANPHVARKYGLRSALSYPLKHEGRLIGYLNHFSSNNIPFTKEELALLEIFAKQVMVTIDLLDRRFHDLIKVRQKMTEFDDVKQLLTFTLDEALKLVNSTSGWVSLLNYRTGEMESVASQGQETPLDHQLRLGIGITGKALETGKTIRAGDVSQVEFYREVWPDTISEIAVPIVIQQAQVRVGRKIEYAMKRIGVVNIESSLPQAFSQSDENCLVSLICQVAAVIERFEYEQKLKKLHEVEKQIIPEQNFNKIIECVLDSIIDILGFEYVNVSLVTPDGQRIKTEYIKGLDPQEAESFKKEADHSLDSGDIQAYVIRSKAIEAPPPDDPRFDPKIFKEFGHQNLVRVFIPMTMSPDRPPIGTFEVGYQRGVREHIYEQDIQILIRLVDFATHVFEQRRVKSLDKIFHECKSPLVGISSHASFLARRLQNLSNEQIVIKLEDIEADCELLRQNIAKLEFILRRIDHVPDVEKALVSVFRDVVIKSITQLKPIFREFGFSSKQIRYDYQDSHKINLYVDKAKLNQVVFNLLMNAIKYAKPEKEMFQLEIEVEERSDTFLIKFKDWGIGVRKGLHEKIFESGFRSLEAISKNVSGSGFGLTISREIMRELEGDLRLARNKNPTEFHVTLPKKLKEPTK